MPAISVSLVRKCHPNVDIECLHLLDVLQLINQDISEIDNLEVFSSVKAIFLNGNKIRRIENLEFLTNLEHLDLTSNKIDAESLKDSIPNIPKSLLSVNLTNNPCCCDEEALNLLQDQFPDLNIIIGIEEDSLSLPQSSTTGQIGANDEAAEISEGNDHEESEDDDEAVESDNEFKLGENMTLDADIVLQQLVERKCRMQQLSAELNIDNVLTLLNEDCNVAIRSLQAQGRFAESPTKSPSRRLMKSGPEENTVIETHEEYVNDSLKQDTKFEEYMKKAEELLRLSMEETNSTRSFMANLQSDTVRKRELKYTALK